MKKKTSIVFTGDIGFDRYMSGRWTDENLIDDGLLAFLRSGDHVVANVEGPVIAQPENTEKTGAKQLLHSIDPAAVSGTSTTTTSWTRAPRASPVRWKLQRPTA